MPFGVMLMIFGFSVAAVCGVAVFLKRLNKDFRIKCGAWAVIGIVIGTVGAIINPSREEVRRVAELATQKEAKAAADRQAAAEREANCPKDLQCSMSRATSTAAGECKAGIQRLAKFDVRWDDGWLTPIFSRGNWQDEAKSIVRMYGDKLSLQNGFGAWQPHVYWCDVKVESGEVLTVGAKPGRLP